MYNLIVGYLSKNRGIGFKNKLPWPMIKKDMDYFRSITTGCGCNNVIMGRKTYESIGRPLKGRKNIVITQNKDYEVPPKYKREIYIANSFNDALKLCDTSYSSSETFVIGGESIYKYAIKRPDCKNVYVTEIDEDYEVDTYFPEIPDNFYVTSTRIDDNLKFIKYTNSIKFDYNSSENDYIKCMKNILDCGAKITDRTNIGTLATFCETLKYGIGIVNPFESDPKKITYKLPLFTTKKMFTNSVIYELLWFLLGKTDAKWLQDRDTHIWDGNSTREFLDSRGLDYPEGQLGPVYGNQWVNWGGDHNTGTGGINQIKNIISLLREKPYSRRAVLAGWNVSDIDKMALPPCHMTYTFTIINNKLFCKLDIRSNDMFLGHPFNVCSASILTIMIARALNIHPGGIGISITNCHIYQNHIDKVKIQISRTPLEYPDFVLDYDISSWDDVSALCHEYDDDISKPLSDTFKISNYNSYPVLRAPMAV